MWLYFFIIYFGDIWAFSPSRKHLLITLLRLDFVVFVLCFSIYFYLCGFNYRCVLKSWSLNHLEPSGPIQACNGIAVPAAVTSSKYC
jgi:hypothetical protein